ncbi:MAG: hypothetical protein GF309_05450 [Candidatus Lokiarchaeota archaeon]|jgi:hypothetical protein|nr:hypothetical protein [Candidatus Lokiarchaeota archaeon]
MNIDDYEFGNIVIDGKRYSSDVIIHPDRVEAEWWRKEGHRLHLEDLTTIFDSNPDILIVGTGRYGRMSVPSHVRSEIEDRGIKLIAKNTKQACETYNELKNGKAVAALHLSC